MYSNDFKWMHMYNGSCFDRDVDALFVRNVRSAADPRLPAVRQQFCMSRLSGQGFSNITELNVSMPIISFAVAEENQRTSTLYCVQSGAIQKYSVQSLSTLCPFQQQPGRVHPVHMMRSVVKSLTPCRSPRSRRRQHYCCC